MMPTAEAKLTDGPVVCSTETSGCEATDIRLSRAWLRIAIAAVFAGQGMVFSLAINMTPPEFASVAYCWLHGGLIVSSLMVLCFLGGPLFASTFGMVRARQLSIEGLFTLSLLGAFGGSLLSTFTGHGAVFYEIVSIVVAIYTIGRLLSERSQEQLRHECSKVREDFGSALLRTADGWQNVSVRSVASGAIVRVDPGMPIAVDGIVQSGSGYVRETALTGEPLPVVRHPGDRVCAGTWSVDGAFEIKVQSGAGARDLDKILRTIEDPAGKPSDLQLQANRLIQYFLPLVAGVSLLTAGYWLWAETWVEAMFNSMAVLLVACPCALGLATPVAIWQGLLRLARMGIVSRDGALIDALARTRRVYFDKTGTLSEASMRIAELLVVESWQDRRAALLSIVYAIESKLSHPIARAIVDHLQVDHSPEVSQLKIIPGKGASALVEGFNVEIGEASLQPTQSLQRVCESLKERGGKRTFVFIDGHVAAVFVLRERLREGVPGLRESFRKLNIEVEVLSGDPEPDIQVPFRLRAGLSATQKAAILADANDQGFNPVLVGDGINDAAAMAGAAASIAMGSGARLTRSVASGQLIHDRIEALPTAIRSARLLMRRLRVNLYYAAAYNTLGMCLAAAGHLHPIAAALIMLLSSFWVTTRAVRAD
ncbi:MAG: heavy metal translocating P-type ATPase [Opitutales bacterium]